MWKYFNYFIIFLSLNFFFSTQVLSVDCEDASGTTETISVDCSVLVIEGDGSINSGVTIDRDADMVVSTKSSTNTTINNNGAIEANNFSQ